MKRTDVPHDFLMQPARVVQTLHRHLQSGRSNNARAARHQHLQQPSQFYIHGPQPKTLIFS